MGVNDFFSKIIPIRQKIYRGRARNFPIGEHPSPLRGMGDEIHNIREWEPGEALENIDLEASLPDWPDKIFLLEMLDEKHAPVIITADISPSMFVRFNENTSKLTLLLDLLGGLGLGANEIRDPVGVLAFADEVEFYLPPRLGSGWTVYGTELILNAAQKFEHLKRQGRTTPKTSDLNGTLNFLFSRFNWQQCAIVILSDFTDVVSGRSQLDYDFIELLSAIHNWNLIAVFLDDPQEFSWKHGRGLVKVKNVETGELKTIKAGRALKVREKFCGERENIRKKLDDIGVDSIVLSHGNHFDEMAEFLSQRKSVFSI